MKLKQIIQTHIQMPASQGYLKNSSRLVTGLFFIAGLSYWISKEYGGYIAILALICAFIVMVVQKIMINQFHKDLADMHHAKSMYEKTKNPDYLQFISLRSAQILKENKVLTEQAKKEINQLQQFALQKTEK